MKNIVKKSELEKMSDIDKCRLILQIIKGQATYEKRTELKTMSNSLSDYKRVLKENEELKFEERSRIIGKYGDAEIHDVINRTLSNDYISVKKIKDKIEELKKDETNKYYYMFLEDRDLENTIQVLQELLERGK